MAIETRCTGCGVIVTIADQHAGRHARCPQCHTQYMVPPTSDLAALEAVCHFCGELLPQTGVAPEAEEFKTCDACRQSIEENQEEIENQQFTSQESWQMLLRCGGFLLGIGALYALLRMFLRVGG
ncbi:MAG: hypothetical protein GTO53_09735 [Planctomycetales bacterium]|nr:hypothetical protein [Planctomycetales bacterium]NIM09403.1 hypothetical protein [Planctomycetales bacterium]NIN08877.1 hypothetical protein [Planctomycetales bacterium]NIN77992.1 hypothetical protein [Planctomycetales bacterium]NIO35175.1 hypothetical protein [Planctomycetales bacterium]